MYVTVWYKCIQFTYMVMHSQEKLMCNAIELIRIKTYACNLIMSKLTPASK